MSGHQVPTRFTLRKLLAKVLISDPDLDAFCLDHFRHVKKRLSSGMERKVKVNLLFEHVPGEKILDRLRAAHPKEVAEHEGLLEWEAADDQ